MSDPIRGFTIEEYANITGGVIFEVRNCLVAIVGYSELAKKELDSSHPAFSHVAKVLQAGERAFATVKQFDREFHRCRNEEGTRGDQA
jgi:hypothetical protein